MKLYAIITDEKGNKRQGSDRIDVEIMGHDKKAIARIKVSSNYPYEYNIEVFPVAYPDKLKLDVKGHWYKLTRKVPKETKG